MNVIKYNFEPNLKKSFIEMNEYWIKKDYVLEDEDRRVLSSIDDSVKNGAIIYFVMYNNIPISTLCLTPLGNSVYELVKFATREGYYNLGAGKMLLEYVINDIRTIARKIIIATNKKCYSAIHLYKKFGFVEFNSNNTFGFSSNRVDICFELVLNENII